MRRYITLPVVVFLGMGVLGILIGILIAPVVNPPAPAPCDCTGAIGHAWAEGYDWGKVIGCPTGPEDLKIPGWDWNYTVPEGILNGTE